METSKLFFDLPEELIAQYPAKTRGESRLLLLDRAKGQQKHHRFGNLPELLPPESVIVLNDSRVRKARIFGTSDTGGRVAFLLVEKIDVCFWKALVSKSKRQKIGKTFSFAGGLEGVIEGGEEEFRLVRFSAEVDEGYLEKWGRVPLPPYIRRSDEDLDKERYQTIYADKTGSIASPTAGLHFSQELLSILDEIYTIVRITLEVGIGTFLPIRTTMVDEHHMHREVYEIDEEAASTINQAKEKGRGIVAVGTTAVRALESAWRGGSIHPGKESTELFIQPGHRFQVVDHLITNFHTPGSTLLLLVGAFAGMDELLEVYKMAILEKYRFYSYGDAMLIL